MKKDMTININFIILLKADKQTFITNVDHFIEEYNDALERVNALNSVFSSYEDTILRNEMLAKNEQIAANISGMIAKVSSEKAAAIAKIDEEIKRLEEQENELLLKDDEESEE